MNIFDNSNIITKNTDDVPFVGISSFSLEDATINLITEKILNNVDLIQENIYYQNESNSYHNIDHSINFEEDTYTYSIKIRSINTKKIKLKINSSYIIFNLVNNSIVDSNTIGSINKLKDNTYLLTITGNATGQGNYGIHFINELNNESFAGDLTKGIVIYYEQLEKKPHMTSYIETERSAGNLELETKLIESSNFFFSTRVRFYTNSYDIQQLNDFLKYNPAGFWIVRTEENVISLILSDGNTQNQLDISITDSSRWQYIALINDNDNWTLYVANKTDGVQKQTINFSMNINGMNKYIVYSDDAADNSLLNGRFADIYFSNYRNLNGDILWTEDKIIEQYQEEYIYKR